MTKKGFPTVHQLDFSSLPAAPGSSGSTQTHTPPQLEGHSSGGGMAKPPKKKKSLFAQQLERHGLEYFGIEVNEGAGGMDQGAAFEKDYVEPVALGGSVLPSSGNSPVGEGRAATEGQSVSVAGGGGGSLDAEMEDSGGVAREEFESGASQAWNRYINDSINFAVHVC